MVIEKCNQGYLKNRRIISCIWLLVWIVVGLAIFFIGYYISHKTKANIFTVMAILMVLPAAKRVVNLVALAGKKGVSKERYEAVAQGAAGAEILCEYVFSSTDKIMHLDFVLIRNEMVLAVLSKSRQDVAYMKKYLTDTVTEAVDYKVKFFDDDKELLDFMKKAETRETNPKKDQHLRDVLRVLAV